MTLKAPPRAQAVLRYWFGKPLDRAAYFKMRGAFWFGGGPEVDAEIRRRFERDVKKADSGRLKSWEKTPEGLLALIILLDQFSLNLYREEARSYTQSAKAIPLAKRALGRGLDEGLPFAYRVFIRMPLMHAENLRLQNEGVAEFRRLVREAPRALKKSLESFHHYAVIHRDVVRKYGRFPGRNECFGRKSSPREEKYLREGGWF